MQAAIWRTAFSCFVHGGHHAYAKALHRFATWEGSASLSTGVACMSGKCERRFQPCFCLQVCSASVFLSAHCFAPVAVEVSCSLLHAASVAWIAHLSSPALVHVNLTYKFTVNLRFTFAPVAFADTDAAPHTKVHQIVLQALLVGRRHTGAQITDKAQPKRQ